MKPGDFGFADEEHQIGFAGNQGWIQAEVSGERITLLSKPLKLSLLLSRQPLPGGAARARIITRRHLQAAL